MYFRLYSAKTSFSFVKAAFTVSGVAVTVGQALVPTTLSNDVCRTSYIGKKMATSGFFTRCAVFNFSDRVQTDESGLLAIAPEAQCFLGGADGAGLSAMFMHNDFRLFAGSAKTIANEIDFRFDYGKIILRSSLQHKTCA